MTDRIADGLSPLILALDTPDLDQARRVASMAQGSVDVVKVGLELFCSKGHSAIEALKGDGFEIFLDLKFHDIPNTVGRAARLFAGFEPFMMTVHISGGAGMIRSTVDALDTACVDGGWRVPLIVGVTVLTSIDAETMKGIGIDVPVERQVLSRAELAVRAGLTGLVASPAEAATLRKLVGEDMVIVTPGVRPPGSDRGDQVRVATPAEAIRAGADFIVVGRPVFTASAPGDAARRIMDSIRKR